MIENKKKISQAVDRARVFFDTEATKDRAFRLKQLISLEKTIKKYEDKVFLALKSDLNKSIHESFMTEVGLVYSALEHTQRKLKKWMKPQRKRPSFAQMPASAKVYSEPYGTVLILSPWNYPFQLTLIPLIGAIGAGNCVLVKPSAYSPETANVLETIINEAFEPGFVQAILGGRKENTALLEQKFDYIFFTGSPRVGRLVMESAAKHLTPVTLELGGKSPCIVDKTAKINQTARRILFGKILNGGQTCVAPDYVLVHENVKEELIQALKEEHKKMISSKSYQKEHCPWIVNEKHFKRVVALLEGQKVIYGGGFDEETRHVDFTIVDEPNLQSQIMKEEIFGPILPIVSWQNSDEAIQFVKNRPKPLSLYAFTSNREFEQKIIKKLSYGGGCINDTLIHISSENQPFGGVGNSGMGTYHGRRSFETFSHEKNVVRKWWAFDLPLRYHPYKNPDKKLPKFLLK